MKIKSRPTTLEKFYILTSSRGVDVLVFHTQTPKVVFQISCYKTDVVNCEVVEDINGFYDLSQDKQDNLMRIAKNWYLNFREKTGNKPPYARNLSDFTIEKEDGSHLITYEATGFQIRIFPTDHPQFFDNIDNENFTIYEHKLGNIVIEKVNFENHSEYLIDSCVLFFYFMITTDRSLY